MTANIAFEQEEIERRADELLNQFASLPPHYASGRANPHLRWLKGIDRLSPEAVVHFFNAWRPLSVHQPQILALLLSAFDDPQVRRKIGEDNLREEDGWQDGHDPHFRLLDNLIEKLGGVPRSIARSETIMNAFHDGLWRPTTPARAAGLLAGIEHPALDISAYFHEVVRRSGFESLLQTDLYLTIHVRVEPVHIVDTHELAARYMNEGPAQRAEVVSAFEEVMRFWQDFWASAFEDLRTMHVESRPASVS
jgi:hypothetical protein